jgi:hypothetical protein
MGDWRGIGGCSVWRLWWQRDGENKDKNGETAVGWKKEVLDVHSCGGQVGVRRMFNLVSGTRNDGTAVGLERGRWGLFVAVVALYGTENVAHGLMGQDS